MSEVLMRFALLFVALLACRAQEASDLVDLPAEVTVEASAVDCDPSYVTFYTSTFTMDIHHDVELDFSPEIYQGNASGDPMSYGRMMEDASDFSPIAAGRGDVLEKTVMVATDCSPEAPPEPQVLPLTVTVSPCRWFGEHCDARYSVEGEIRIVLDVVN